MDNALSWLNFIPSQHTTCVRNSDPCHVSLRKPFAVCVLGAGRGIGAAVARAYAIAGASSIALAARTEAELHRVEEDIKTLNPHVQLLLVQCDITLEADVERLATRIEEQFTRLDAVISSSGYAGPMILSLTKGTPEDFHQCSDVNYFGTYLAARHLVPLLLRSEHGAKAFVSISAMAGAIYGGIIGNPAYCISKMAQIRLIEFMDQEFASQGLLSVAVHPGAVKTKMAEVAPKEFHECTFLEVAPYPKLLLLILVDLVDEPTLCGGFCVWLTKDVQDRRWLAGRLVSATWDVDALYAKREEIQAKNLLKFRITLGD
ncbi:MAG: hypothetical protein M1822_004716 [Bathelium mastoideum]|nr:MAG: hypothetical protein M1822_004716 [Bathelium mastoideum]